MNVTLEACGACGAEFPSLAEVFSHPCPALSDRRAIQRAAGDPDDPAPSSRPLPDGAGGGPRDVNPTEKQVAFWSKLVGEAGLDVGEERTRLHEVGRWSRKMLSAEIDRLLGKADAPPVVGPREPRGTDVRPSAEAPVSGEERLEAPPSRAPQPAVRRNRYEGRCSRCHAEVPAEAGVLSADGHGHWIVAHEGPCPEKAPEPVLADVPEGHYAIPSTGDNDLAFYRVDRPEGRGVFVKLVVGGKPDRNVQRSHVAGILARIVEAGVAEAGQLYGQEIGRCCRCNRHLTDEESRRLGIGPDCRARSGG